MKNIQIYSGSASKKLASKIAQDSKGILGKIEISKFANDEKRVWVRERKVSKEAVVVQSLSAPVDEHIVEFALICDALQRIGVQEITAIIPWLAYTKQDKVFRPGDALSVKVIAKILQVVPITKLYTFDLHNLAILGFFDIPVVNLTAKPLFIDYFKNKTSEKTVVVAPDAGAIKSSTDFAGELGVRVVYMDKKRDLKSGKVDIVGISNDVNGKDVIMIDDMIVTGSTVVEAAKVLKEKGAKSIVVATTHHLNVPGAQKKIERSGVDRTVITDTIDNRPASDRVKVLSVSSLVSGEIVI